MKKVFLMAAVAAMTLASCSQETNPTADKTGQLIIKFDATNSTRALDGSWADTDDITLSNGWIFVFKADGTILRQEKLLVGADAPANGQLLKGGASGQDNGNNLIVAGSEKVYIIGNLPEVSGDEGAAEAAILAALNNANAILAKVSTYALADLQGNDKFKTIPVANATGLPAAFTGTTAPVDMDGDPDTIDYLAEVALSPLVSRVELVEINSKSDTTGEITAYTVGGVYIDSYYEAFTYGGAESGTTYEQNQNTVLTGNIGYNATEGPWVATGTSPVMTAKPANDEVWAFNVPSKGVARLIIHLKSVTYTPAGGGTAVTLDDQFLTVSRYQLEDGEYLTDMERGHIYRIGVADENEFEFGPGDLDPVPNPGEGTLTIKVTVSDWEVELPDAELM